MLPQDAIVFFVDTDGIVDLQNLPPAVSHLGAEVVDVPQTVTAECERVCQHPDAIFAGLWRGAGVGNLPAYSTSTFFSPCHLSGHSDPCPRLTRHMPSSPAHGASMRDWLMHGRCSCPRAWRA